MSALLFEVISTESSASSPGSTTAGVIRSRSTTRRSGTTIRELDGMAMPWVCRTSQSSGNARTNALFTRLPMRSWFWSGGGDITILSSMISVRQPSGRSRPFQTSTNVSQDDSWSTGAALAARSPPVPVLSRTASSRSDKVSFSLLDSLVSISFAVTGTNRDLAGRHHGASLGADN
nr:hypothetical protein [Saccharopolyspora sp. 6V]